GFEGLELPFMLGTLLTGSALTAAVTALLMLLGFAVPSLLHLLRVSPLRVLRTDLLPTSWSGWRLTLLAWLSLFGFVVFQTGQLGLSLALLGGLTLLMLALFGLIFAGLYTVKRLGWAQDGLVRQPVASSLRILSLSLGLGLVGVVLLLRGDLLDRWQDSLPVGTPNHFVYGLPPEQKSTFEQALDTRQLPETLLFPMVRGRLVQINGEPLSAEVKQDRTAQRELNLTMSSQFHDSNTVVAGRPFTAPNQVSVEQEVAERLGMKLGDQVTMSLPAGEVEAEIVSLRTVDWNSFQPNFFFIYSPETLDPNAGSYLGSFYVAPEQRALLPSLIREFPSALLIDVEAILAEIRRLLALLGQALGLLAGLVAVSGVLVLLA
ncbi:MAG: ABC transporter permease, partial [Pseudomonadota bacterium]|nr:ABC transporter permease [Pseudomonadota bacterium]